MDIFFTFLIEKGGIFGLLLLTAILWILYREKFYYQNQKHSQAPEGTKSDLSKVLFIVEDLKNIKDIIFTKSDYDKLNTLLIEQHKNQKQHFIEIDNLLDKMASILSELNSLNQDSDEKLQDLWKWHSVFDDEGVPVWYVRKSLEESIESLDLTINNFQEKCVLSNELVRGDLIQKLHKTNDERIVELKVILENYNKTMTGLIVTLEKIKHLVKPEYKNGV
jgi:hypothetical protein